MGRAASDGLSLLDHAKAAVRSRRCFFLLCMTCLSQAENLVKARLRAGLTAPDEHVILCTSPPPDDVVVDWNTPSSELLPRLRNVRLGDVGDVQHSVRLALSMWSTHTCARRSETWLEGQKPWLVRSQFVLLLTDASGLDGGVGVASGAGAPLASLLAQSAGHAAAAGGGNAAVFMPPSLPRAPDGISLLTPLGSAGETAAAGGGRVFPQPPPLRSLVSCLGSHLNRWGTRIYAMQFTGHGAADTPVHARLHALCAAGGGRAVAVPSLKSAIHKVQGIASKIQHAGPKIHLQIGRPGDECTVASLRSSSEQPMLLRARQITPRQLGGAANSQGLMDGMWPIPEPFMPCRGVTAVEEGSAGAASSKGGTRRPQQGVAEVPKHLVPPRPSHPTLVVLPDATPHNKEAVAHVLHRLSFPADVYDLQKCAVTDALFSAHASAAQLRNRAARAAAANGQVSPDELSASVAWSVAVAGSGTTRSWHIARRRQHALQTAAAAAAAKEASTSRRTPEAQWRQDSAISALLQEDSFFTGVLQEHGVETAPPPDSAGPWDELWRSNNTPLRTRCGFLAMSEDKLVRDIPARASASQGSKPLMGVLVLLPWDYPTLFELLTQLHESAQAMPRAAEVAWRRRHKQPYKPGSLPFLAHAAEAEPAWRQAFTDYLERVPGYYLVPLMSALAPYCLDHVVMDCLLPPGQQDIMAGLLRSHRHMPPMEALDWLNFAQKATEQLSAELRSQSRVPPLEEVTGFNDSLWSGDASDVSSVCSSGSVSSLMSAASGYSYAVSDDDDLDSARPGEAVLPTERTAEAMRSHSVPAQLMSNYASRVQYAAENNLRNPLAEDPDADRAEALRPLFGNPYAFQPGRRPGQRGLLLSQLSTAGGAHAPADEMDMLSSNDAALLSDPSASAPGGGGGGGASEVAASAADDTAHAGTHSAHGAVAESGIQASMSNMASLGQRLSRWARGAPLLLGSISVPPLKRDADSPAPTAAQLITAALKRKQAFESLQPSSES